jgi:hypothetical protein
MALLSRRSGEAIGVDDDILSGQRKLVKRGHKESVARARWSGGLLATIAFLAMNNLLREIK